MKNIMEQLIKCREAKATAELELKTINERLATLKQLAREQLDINCLDSVKFNGVTIYAKNEKWIRKATTDDHMALLLRENGFGDLVKETVNANSLQATMREILRSDEPIPQPLLEALTITDVETVGMRTS